MQTSLILYYLTDLLQDFSGVQQINGCRADNALHAINEEAKQLEATKLSYEWLCHTHRQRHHRRLRAAKIKRKGTYR